MAQKTDAEHHPVTLSLNGGKVTPSTMWLQVNPGHTLEFSSKDGDEVDIQFEPRDAVDPVTRGLKVITTVRKVPFEFRCRVKPPGRSEFFGWPEHKGAGGCGQPDPPHIDGIQPTPLPRGSSNTDITLFGLFCPSGSIGQVNGNDRPTPSFDKFKLVMTVLESDLQTTTGSISITVRIPNNGPTSGPFSLQLT